DVRRISPITATNAISLMDTPERIAAAGQLIRAIDKVRPGVGFDVELLEVNRTKLSEYGMQFVSVGSAGVNGSVQLPSDLTLETLTNLTQSDVVLAGIPALADTLPKDRTTTPHPT